jgi:hypothetical protein
MRDRSEEPLFTMGAALLTAVIFAIYGAVLLSLDPDWVLWAGSMAMGSLYVPEPAPRLLDDPRRALEIGSGLCLLGLVALLGLMVLAGDVVYDRLNAVKVWWHGWVCARSRGQARWSDGGEPGVREVDCHRET